MEHCRRFSSRRNMTKFRSGCNFRQCFGILGKKTLPRLLPDVVFYLCECRVGAVDCHCRRIPARGRKRADTGHGIYGNQTAPAAVAEWLRRLTRNQMGYARAGSNPARCAIFFSCDFSGEFLFQIEIHLWSTTRPPGTRTAPPGTTGGGKALRKKNKLFARPRTVFPNEIQM